MKFFLLKSRESLVNREQNTKENHSREGVFISHTAHNLQLP